MNSVFNLGNPFDLPAPENFWFLKESSPLTLFKYASLHISCGGKSNLDWKGLLTSLDCWESERIYPAVEFNVSLFLNGFIFVLGSFLRQLCV